MKLRFLLSVAILALVPMAVMADDSMFNQAKAGEFDPGKTQLVQAAWIDGIGCPTNATTFDGTTSTPYTDDACPTGDPRDKNNAGLLLNKEGPTANDAAAFAVLKQVPSTITDL